MSARHEAVDLPAFILKKRAEEDAAEAREQRLYAAMFPRPGRLIVEQPSLATSHEQRRTAAGLFAPDQAWRSLREYGLKTRVLKIHPDDAPRLEFKIGDIILIPEHSGHPIYVEQELPYWIVGINEVMATLHPSPSC